MSGEVDQENGPGENSIESEARTMDTLRLKNSKLAEELTKIVTALKRRKLMGSYDVALQTCKLYRNILSAVFFETIDCYIDLIRGVARILLAAQPLEVVSGCMARRVLAIMREYAKTVAAASLSSTPPPDLAEAASAYAKAVAEQKASQITSLSAAGTSGETGTGTSARSVAMMPLNEILNPEASTLLSAVQYRPIRSSILDDINTELIESLEADRRAPRAADFAEDHIHNKQVIFTYGFSHTVLHFLKVAAWGHTYQKKFKDVAPKKKREFEVVVSGLATALGGRKMAQHLAAIGIQTTVVPDASMFTIMARVHKVITGTHAIMANGAVVAASGTRLVALAAKHFSVPYICVTGLYKVAPTYPCEKERFIEQLSPSSVLSFLESDIASVHNVDVANPAFDYVSPNLITLFVTSNGGVQPCYIYRILQENYHRDDYDLETLAD